MNTMKMQLKIKFKSKQKILVLKKKKKEKCKYFNKLERNWCFYSASMHSVCQK